MAFVIRLCTLSIPTMKLSGFPSSKKTPRSGGGQIFEIIYSVLSTQTMKNLKLKFDIKKDELIRLVAILLKIALELMNYGSQQIEFDY